MTITGVLLVAVTVWSGGVDRTAGLGEGVRTLGAVAAPAAAPFCVITPPPIPLLPEDGDTVLATQPVLEVESPVGSGLFHFRVMEEASVVAEGYSLVPYWSTAAVGRELQRGHSYHWSCRVRGVSGWSGWFEPDWRFVVGHNLPTPEPKLPEDGGMVLTLRPLFAVRPVLAPVKYRFRVSDGKTLVGEGTSNLPCWVYEGEPLRWGNRYQWTCRLETEDDSGAWFVPEWGFETVRVPSEDAVAECGRTGLASVSAHPNPFRDVVEISLGTGEFRDDVRLEVSDACGRTVRTMAAGSRPARPGRFLWDGRDRFGREAGPGAYFCRVVSMRHGAGEEVVKLVKTH